MPKLYSSDFRIQAVSCVNRGKSHEEVCDFFGIGIATLYRWLKLDQSGKIDSANCRKSYGSRSLSVEKLLSFFDDFPDSTLEEAAAEFNCSYRTIDYWCTKLSITRKKNHIIH